MATSTSRWDRSATSSQRTIRPGERHGRQRPEPVGDVVADGTIGGRGPPHEEHAGNLDRGAMTIDELQRLGLESGRLSAARRGRSGG